MMPENKEITITPAGAPAGSTDGSQQTKVSASSDDTLEIFLKDLNFALEKERKVISSIKVNGQLVSSTDEQQILNTQMKNLGEIEILTTSPEELAYQTLTTLDEFIDKMVLAVESASSHYKDKNIMAGDAYFTRSIDSLDLFVQTIGSIKMALRIGLHSKIALVEASLVSVMNDLLSAKRDNNYVFLSELLGKDLKENLGEWKTVIFPIFRTWKNN